MTTQPHGELANLLAQPRHGLLVHVCLGEELGQGDDEAGEVLSAVDVTDGVVL